MVRHLAHELRQPLSAIESIAYYLEIILPRGDSRSREQVEKLQYLTQQANWVLSDAIYLLQAATSNPEQLDLHEVLSNCAAQWSKGDHLNLRLQLMDGACLVRMDPEQAAHLLRNLFHVFRQFGRPGEAIRVSTSLSAQRDRVWLELACSSTTHGAEDLERMFEPFHSQGMAGSGLALACARRIAQAHGGDLQASSGPAGEVALTLALPGAQ